MTDPPTPPPCAPAMERPKRRTLLLRCLADLGLCVLVGVPLFVPAVIVVIDQAKSISWSERQDRWRFEAMPPNDDELAVWAATRTELRNFRAERPNGSRGLLLRYERDRVKGPATPDWDALGYRRAYLVESRRKTPEGHGAHPVPWLGSWVFWSFILAAVCGMGAAAFFLLRRTRRSGAPLIGLSSAPARGWWKWLLLACGALPLLRLMQSALLRVLNIGSGSADPIAAAVSQTKGWLLCLVVAGAVLASPISEELLFRGLLLGRFRVHGYLVSGTILSAVLFTVLHLDPRHYLELFGAGLLLAWLYHRTNSLWPPIALHALNNGWDTMQAVLSATS